MHGGFLSLHVTVAPASASPRPWYRLWTPCAGPMTLLAGVRSTQTGGMPEIHELDLPTCARLIRRGAFGRFAFVSPRGPEIVPVNYAVHGDAVVVRTAPDSALARHGAGAELIFEVDAVDRSCVLRMPWTELTGRAVGRRTGLESLLPVGRAL